MLKLNISRPVEALISLLSLCLYTARIFPRLENPQLWAEDGSNLLETAFESDLPFSLLARKRCSDPMLTPSPTLYRIEAQARGKRPV